MMICQQCGKIFDEPAILDEDGCVDCGLFPCYHCRDEYEACPTCNSSEIEELAIDFLEGMGECYIRVTDDIRYDKTFILSDGNEEMCHYTGVEVCLVSEDPMDGANWWGEYEDMEGNYHYGR